MSKKTTKIIFMIKTPCRNCGCTDDDCSGCIKATGKKCHWVSEGKCSACYNEFGYLKGKKLEPGQIRLLND